MTFFFFFNPSAYSAESTASTGAEAAIFSILSNSAEVTSYVPASRITPVAMAQNSALVAISYFRVDGPRVYSMSGPSGYAFPRIQIDVWGRDYPEVKNVTERVRQALSGYRGVIAGVTVQSILFLGEVDFADDQDELLPNEAYHIAMDFRVHHNE